MTDLDEPDVWRLRRDAAESGKIDRRSARFCGVKPPCRCTGIAFGEFPGIDGLIRSAKTHFVYESTA